MLKYKIPQIVTLIPFLLRAQKILEIVDEREVEFL